MAHVVPLMYSHVGAKLGKVLFATDASGEGAYDEGGFGIVATTINDHEMDSILALAEQPGLSVAVLSDVGGAKYPDKPLIPTVPFSRLPNEILREDRWKTVSSGRWFLPEHITIKEARTVVKMLRIASADVRMHDSVLYSLQDNQPTACSFRKGRSPAFALNTQCRKKAAVCLAAEIALRLPWVETKRQPADQASREEYADLFDQTSLSLS